MIALKVIDLIVGVCSAQDCGMLFTYNEQHYLFDTLCHIVKWRNLELDFLKIFKFICRIIY